MGVYRTATESYSKVQRCPFAINPPRELCKLALQMHVTFNFGVVKIQHHGYSLTKLIMMRCYLYD